MAIRLANSDNAAIFKEEFEKAQKNNIELKATSEDKEEEKEEDAKEEKKDAEEKEEAKEKKEEEKKEESA